MTTYSTRNSKKQHWTISISSLQLENLPVNFFLLRNLEMMPAPYYYCALVVRVHWLSECTASHTACTKQYPMVQAFSPQSWYAFSYSCLYTLCSPAKHNTCLWHGCAIKTWRAMIIFHTPLIDTISQRGPYVWILIQLQVNNYCPRLAILFHRGSVLHQIRTTDHTRVSDWDFMQCQALVRTICTCYKSWISSGELAALMAS
jgi:hypothetical protein